MERIRREQSSRVARGDGAVFGKSVSTGGGAPPAPLPVGSNSLDFSNADNSMYVPLLFNIGIF